MKATTFSVEIQMIMMIREFEVLLDQVLHVNEALTQGLQVLN